MKKRCLQELGECIIRIKPESFPVIVAVDGPDGAGKSFFSGKLSEMLPESIVVPMDDFITWDSIENGAERAIRQLFVPLKTTRVARYQARDRANDRFGEGPGDWKNVLPSDVVIKETMG